MSKTQNLQSPQTSFSIESIHSFAPNLLKQLQLFLTNVLPKYQSTSTHSSKQENKQVLLVGLSGGLDSTVLLYLLNQMLQSQPELKNRVVLQAMHVNHGISQFANEWSTHCEQFCEALGVGLHVEKITLGSTKRQGLEAVARHKRYSAFINYMHALEKEGHTVVLLTGHHQRDQAETVLHNLTRGAGINGLAAMPACKELKSDSIARSDLKHCRPMLKVAYDEIVNYAKAHHLEPVYDESNHDTCFKRNMIRHEVLPYLQNHWPHIQRSLVKTADHMQEALLLLDELASEHLSHLDYQIDFIALNVNLSLANQKNVLRYWLKQYWPNVVLSDKHYNWVFDSLASANTSQNGEHCYQLSAVDLKIYKNKLYICPKKLQSFIFHFSSLAGLQGFLDNDAQNSEAGLANNRYVLSLANASLKSNSYAFKINSLSKVSNVSLSSYDILSGKAMDRLDKKKIKAFFQAELIPAWERKKWPVLLVNEEVLFLGCSQCSDYAVLDKVLEIEVSCTQRKKWMSD